MFQSIHRTYLLILPHHPSQYDVTDDVYCTILSTLPVVYKSGFLGTKSPRLDFFCILRYSVNRSPPEEHSPFPSGLIPLKALFIKTLCLRRSYSSSEAWKPLFATSTYRTQNQTLCHVPSRSTYPMSGEHPYCDITASSLY